MFSYTLQEHTRSKRTHALPQDTGSRERARARERERERARERESERDRGRDRQTERLYWLRGHTPKRTHAAE